MKKENWNTVSIRGYTYDCANDQRSAGGVHMREVRRTKSGHWQTRIRQSNGAFTAYSPVQPINDAEGESMYATAEQQGME